MTARAIPARDERASGRLALVQAMPSQAAATLGVQRAVRQGRRTPEFSCNVLVAGKPRLEPKLHRHRARRDAPRAGPPPHSSTTGRRAYAKPAPAPAAGRAARHLHPATDASHPKQNQAHRGKRRRWACGRCAGAHRRGPWTTWVHVAHRPRLRPHAHRLPPRSDQKTQSKANAIAHRPTGSARHAVTQCGKNSAVIYEGSWQPTRSGAPVRQSGAAARPGAPAAPGGVGHSACQPWCASSSRPGWSIVRRRCRFRPIPWPGRCPAAGTAVPTTAAPPRVAGWPT